LTPKYIEHAKQLYPEADVKVASVLDLPFPNAAFDVVYCKDLLGHLPLDKWRVAVSELWRVAKKVMFAAEMVFTAKSETYLDGYGFYQNTINLTEFTGYLKTLPRFRNYQILGENLGYNKTMVIQVTKKGVGVKQIMVKKQTSTDEPTVTPTGNTAFCPVDKTYQAINSFTVDSDARFIFSLVCGHDLALELRVVADGEQVKVNLKKTEIHP